MGSFSIVFLGTCAYDYSKKLETEYKNRFDLDARRSSSVLLNDRFLIDCGTHCMEELRIAKADICAITDIFITHLHSDHYNEEHISNIAKGKKAPLRVWVREGADLPSIPNTEICYMIPKTEYEIGDGLLVTGLKANHAAETFPQHLLFERNGKKFLYACDGAWFLSETYNALENVDLDLLVLDGTCGDYSGDYRMAEHNSIPMIRLMVPSLKTWGTIGEKTQVFISHIAPSLHKPHDETAKLLKRDNVKVAYDGLKIEI